MTQFSWQVEGHRLRIECPQPVLEAIDRLVVEGFQRLPHDGLEVGGVLFGVRHGDTVRVTAHRPIFCEHAAGPAFVLSASDRARLRLLLETAGHDPALVGLQPIGWYHSHTQSGILLSDHDLHIHNRYFPEPWQVALVLHPERDRPTRAGFFFREPDGAIRSESSYKEFVIGEPAPAEPVPAEPARAASPVPETTAPVEIPQFFAEPSTERSPRWRWAALVLTLGAAGTAAVLAFVYWYPQAPSPFLLRAVEVDGQMHIEWDRDAASIRAGRRAEIEIRDGRRTVPLDLDGDRLRQGAVSYARQTETVNVRMRVHGPWRRPVEEFLSFVGRPPLSALPADMAEAVRQRDALRYEADRLRAELDAERIKNRRLEEYVRGVQLQLRRPATPPASEATRPQ